MIRRKTRSITLVVLLLTLMIAQSITISAQASPRKPVIIQDHKSYNSYIDVHAIEIDDNQTHLLLKFKMGSAIPRTNETTNIYTWLYNILIDLDNNILTGLRAAYLKNATTWEWGIIPGIDLIYEVIYYGTGSKYPRGMYIDMRYYYPDGSYAGSRWAWIGIPGHLTTGKYLVIPLNLTWLASVYQELTGIPISVKTVKLVISADIMRGFYLEDFPSVSQYSAIVNFSTVTVDGNVSEWDPARTLLLRDGKDDDFSPIDDANFTAIYVATDNRSLFFRVDLEGLANQYFNSTDDLSEYRVFRLVVEWGGKRYHLHMTPWYIYIRNETSGWWGWFLDAWSRDYNVSWYGTSTVEFGVNLSLIGLDGFRAGDVINVSDIELWLWTEDRVPSAIVMYELGEGGFANNLFEAYYGVSGAMNLSLGNMNVSINTTNIIDVYAGYFAEEPIGLGGLGAIFSSFTGYYYLEVSDSSAVVWPINITIKYDDMQLARRGLNESRITMFFYDKYADRYVELDPSLYRVDPDANLVYVTITEDIYNRSDLTLVPAAPPQVVGGKLIMPSGSLDNALSVSAGVLLAASIFLAAGATIKRRKNLS